MKLSIIAEVNKDYLEAVKLYEKEIEEDHPPTVDSYINLAFIYWCFAFELFEFNIPNNILDEWSVIGGKRYSNILEMGLSNYPRNIELNFWKKYFSHISFGERFSDNDCRELLDEYGDTESIVPYFFLYLFDKEKYTQKKNDLIEECNKVPTAKNLYIKSIIG